METIRIVLLDIPPLLRDVIRAALDASPDIEIVAEVPEPDRLIATLADERARVVLVSQASSELERIARNVLGRFPEATVVALSCDAREACLYEIGRWKQPLGDLSPNALAATIERLRRRPRSGADDDGTG